ncbi:hypothetical protein HPP92_011697 [Vanilla planifolia]|uniref:Uncharacterized protein n=1 Tax=Vanilla planifolia TaxID=51239 RepID=A0A835R2C1_VANPL|nr:hypothetical protein HPP92_011697 [Vanilla planifolia]
MSKKGQRISARGGCQSGVSTGNVGGKPFTREEPEGESKTAARGVVIGIPP